MKKIVHDPEAKRDMIAAAQFYETRVKGLGSRFLRAVDATILKIASDPQMYAFYRKPIKSCRVNGFPYRVLFADESESVLILAIAHLARQPGWWHYRTDS